jgi:hypothetical protein
VRWLKKLNPGVKVVGMYGGTKAVPGRLLASLHDNWISPFDAKFNWQNCDLVLVDWFKKCGKLYKFDVLNLIEWDWLVLEPLNKVYGTDTNTIELTGKGTFKSAYEGNWWWSTREMEQPFKEQVTELENFFGKQDYANFEKSMFGGIQIPRKFLEEYSKYSPSPLTNDEARMCLWAQAMGFKMADNGTGKNPSFVTSDGKKAYAALDYDEFSGRVESGAIALHPVRTLSLFKKLTSIKRQK